MNKDEIIKWAQEAGAMFDNINWVERDLDPVFERFATLIAEREREACAKVCEDMIGTRAFARHCVDAIRARGTT